MRSILKITVSTALMLSAGLAVEIQSIEKPDLTVTLEEKEMATPINVTKIKVKDNGVDSFILIPERDSTKIGTLSPNKDDKLNLKKGIMIVFKDTEVSTEAFETLFNIKFKEKLQSGYYIFENPSTLSDIQLMESILKSENGEKIKTIRPNWEMGVRKF